MAAKHLAYLDGWRGVAILCVLIAHFSPYEFGVDWGRMGVDLFFVLSGLLMSRILFEDRTPIRLFYRRRVARILPAFLVFVGIMVVVFDHTSPRELVGLLTFTRTYMMPPVGPSSAPVGNLWSLNVEEHSYILLSLIAFFAPRRARQYTAALAGVCVVAITVHWLRNPLATDLWMRNTECAATGLMASAALRTVRFPARSWVAPITLLAGAFCYLRIFPWWLSPYLAPLLFAVAVNNVGHCAPIVRVLSFRAVTSLGLISYSVYLWQQPFYAHKLPIPHAVTAALLCAVSFGAASYFLIELPARRWLNLHWKPRTPSKISHPTAA